MPGNGRWTVDSCNAIIASLDSCAKKACLTPGEQKSLVAAHLHLYETEKQKNPLLGGPSPHINKSTALLESLLAQNSEDHEALLLKASSLKATGKTKDAISLYQSLLEVLHVQTFGFQTPAAALSSLFRKDERWSDMLKVRPYFDSTATMFTDLFDALWKTGQDVEATSFYLSNVAATRDRDLLNRLFEDIRCVLDKSQLQAWSQSDDPQWQRGFLLRFWKQQNPTLNRDENPRLVEHYRRLEFARTYFSQGKSNCLTCFDERGLVYVRRGQPTVRFVFEPESFATPPSESWLYGDTIRFDFVSNAFGEYEMRPLPFDQFEERAHLHPFYQRMAWKLKTIPSPRDRKRIMDEIESTVRSDYFRIEMNDFPRTTYSYSSNFDHLSFATRRLHFVTPTDDPFWTWPYSSQIPNWCIGMAAPTSN